MTQSAITLYQDPGLKLKLQCGIEWEDMLCTIFHITQSTQHEYTEGL